MPDNQTLKVRFQRLDTRRKTLLTRAQGYSEISIPSLYPREGTYESAELPVPFSSATSRGINRMGSRLVSTMIPLNDIPFFQAELDDSDPVGGEDPSEEYKVLGRMQRRIMSKLASTNLRAAVNNAVQHLQVTGNALLMSHDNYNYTVHRIDQYVIRRRPDGEWHEIVLREFVDPSMLPQVLLDAQFANQDEVQDVPMGSIPDTAMYTQVINDHKGGCSIEREYQDRKFGKGDYKVCPYIPLRWLAVDGEHYGRGLIEDNLGDIRAIEIMAEALLDSIAANAEYRFGVNPAGMTEIHDLMTSTNGAFVPAAPNDVFPIQLGNQAQVAAAQTSVTLKEQTLGHVFLMNSVVQPQGDRVTAYQVRVIAQELEQALGGVFSTLSRELLIPVVRRCMYQMTQDKTLFPDDVTNAGIGAELQDEAGVLKLRIKTGLEALSREVEHEKMDRIMDKLVQAPEPAQQAVIWPGILNRWFATSGIESEGLVKSVAQMQAEIAAAQQQQMAMAAQQQAIQSTGRVAEQQAAAAAVQE